jgi:hypothetical protein
VQGGAPAFVPTDIAGCQLWLDASDASTISIGTGVSQWDDKSGNARHATQGTGASQPSYILSEYNGLNTVRFNGSVNWMDNSNLPLFNGKTVFVVSKISGTFGGEILQFAKETVNTQFRHIVREIIISGTYFIGGDTIAKNMTLTTPLSAGSWTNLHLGKWIQNNSTLNFIYSFNNGSNLAITDNPPNGRTAPDAGYRLGAIKNVDGNIQNNYSGDICEVIVYDRDDLTTDDVNNISNYLSNKWAI